MATSIDLLKKYTDEKYFSRKELIDYLHFRLIDQLWYDIEAYRYKKENIDQIGSMKLANLKPLRYSIITKVYEKYNSFEAKLTYLQGQYMQATIYPEQKKSIDRTLTLQVLKAANVLCGSPLSDLGIKAVINGQYRESDLTHRPVVNYFETVSRLGSMFGESDPSSFLASVLESQLGMGELVSFYRETDYSSKHTTAVISRQYEAAPANMIETLMDDLYTETTDGKEKGLVKALTALYFIHYVKPFDTDNDLLASAYAKYILAKSNLASIAPLLPLEQVLIETERLKDYESQIQKTGDVTYFVLYAIDVLSPLLDTLLDGIAKAKSSAIAKEVNSMPIEQARIEAPEVVKEVEARQEPEQKLVEVEAPSSEKPAPVRHSDPNVETIDALPGQNEFGQRALTAPPARMSDKEVKETARYILETNPALKKSQATFYATHCTIGRYYSIDDYKKSVRCAYETARTSMDTLAAEGFYKKYKIKKKYVYTPIKQGGKDN
ncbi:MAG: hypothetical protein K6F32_05175 [Bacilli bacterium]|nr:hypothetical protein [Bacilli bacterium]